MVKPGSGSGVVTGPTGTCELLGRRVAVTAALSVGTDGGAGPVPPSGGSAGNTGFRPGDVGGVCIIR